MRAVCLLEMSKSTEGSVTAHRRGDARRRAIMAFVYQYQQTDERGPLAVEIARAVGYRGHGIRSKHLDKMPALTQGDDGRWRIVE